MWKVIHERVIRKMNKNEAGYFFWQGADGAPSEKSFAYKMRLDAMKRQGERTDLTSGQLVQKLETKNPTLVLSEVECGIGEDGFCGLNNIEKRDRIDSNKELAMQYGENERQIRRYIPQHVKVINVLQDLDPGYKS
jgi:ParB family chromosome partitioning protein